MNPSLNSIVSSIIDEGLDKDLATSHIAENVIKAILEGSISEQYIETNSTFSMEERLTALAMAYYELTGISLQSAYFSWSPDRLGCPANLTSVSVSTVIKV